MNNVLILGAGSGLRLGCDKPKGFIEIHNKTLIELSVDKLLRKNYSNITIVTGFKKEFYEIFCKEKEISYIYNPLFNTLGSGESLLVGLDHIRDSCLVLESDILYDERMLNLIKEDSTLISTPTGNGDEVYVRLVNEKVVELSKNKKSKNEFVGITYLSKRTVLEILSHKYKGNLEYEQIIVNFNLNGIKTDYKWCEIDDINQLNIAKKLYDIIESRTC